jgi:hypothetical protein
MLLKLSLTAALAATLALGADPFYLGTWKIDSAVVAPWADGSRPLDQAEMKSLVNQMVAIKPAEITGPHALACKGPKYVVKNYSADMLFQGAFDEMRRRDKSKNPAKIAASLGFQGTSWKTLETGCGNELDFHFLDPSTMAFGLNDYVYKLKKQ